MGQSDCFEQIDLNPQRENNLWPSIIIGRSTIEDEISRLSSIELPPNGRRDSRIVHPQSSEQGLGLAPGIEVLINVVNPGETTVPARHNAGQVSMCIQGDSGVATVNGKAMSFGKFDVWNTPSMNAYSLTNNGDKPIACLTYSNSALLRKLEVYYAEDECSMPSLAEVEAALVANENRERSKDKVPMFPMGDDGAWLGSYEHLVDPDFVVNRPLIWPFEIVRGHLEKVRDMKVGYTGRRLYLLYNPATQERNGTTHNFFATIAAYPPNLGDVMHRHSSAAINYYMSGNGHSIVEGEEFDWEGGDLMLSAPGWAKHVHSSRDQGFYSLTIQDHPLHIASESLIWQESMEVPIRNLGTEMGFQTNVAELTG